MSMSVYQVKNLNKKYGSNLCLKDVALTVRQGDFMTLKGPSGCGKSTLLHIIAGIENYDEGDVFFQDKDFKLFNKKDWIQFRRFSLGMIFQFFHLFPRLTVQDNILLPARLAGVCDTVKKERAQMLMELTGTQALKHKNVQQLSGGEMQRVSIARALINNPKVLLADEPTGNLDSKNSERVLNLLQDIHKNMGCTMVIVTHDPVVFDLGERQLTMLDGKITE